MYTKSKKSGQLGQGPLSFAFLLFISILIVLNYSCSEKGLNTQPKSTGNLIKNSKDFQYTTISYEQFLRQLKKSNNIELLNAVDSKKSRKKATNGESDI